MGESKWEESFESLGAALDRLEEVLVQPLDEDRIIIDATIQRFEFLFELFWKTVKRFLLLEGFETKSPRETLQKAYQLNWIDDEKIWLEMMRDRNITSHVYDEDKAKEIFEKIKKYAPLMRGVYKHLWKRRLPLLECCRRGSRLCCENAMPWMG